MKILLTPSEISDEFIRCCNYYDDLFMAVAWVGEIGHNHPFMHLKKLKKIKSTIGIAFNQSSPNGIRFLLNLSRSIKIFDQRAGTFHPKIYLFEKNDEACLILGSSNLTKSAFSSNSEANVSYAISNKSNDDVYQKLKQQLDAWFTGENSFTPDSSWIESYEAKYLENINKLSNNGTECPQQRDSEEKSITWLKYSDWDNYYKQVRLNIPINSSLSEEYDLVLRRKNTDIPTPWKLDYLQNIETRKLIGGRHPFGALGNTTANGNFAGLLRSGSRDKHNILLEAINDIANLSHPIDFPKLESSLLKLVNLGFRMSCWGRLLCLVRPDLYPTVASPNLRKNLSKLINIKEDEFNLISGYIKLIMFLHETSWYNHGRPKDPDEIYVWENRIAFIDPIFYNL